MDPHRCGQRHTDRHGQASVDGYATGTFNEMTIGGSTVQDSQTGQIVTIGNNTIASGTDITITSGNSNTTASMLGSISGVVVSCSSPPTRIAAATLTSTTPIASWRPTPASRATAIATSGNSVVAGSSGGTSLDYSAGNYNSVTAQYQSLGTFSPTRYQRHVQCLAVGKRHSRPDAARRLMTSSEPRSPALPGGMYQVATMDEGISSLSIRALSSYVYDSSGSFTPSAPTAATYTRKRGARAARGAVTAC